MVSFSSWNGVKNHGNRSLLTGVLKDRMGFAGLVVGDWNAHGQIPGCTVTDCVAALDAGLDMYMAPDSWKGLYDKPRLRTPGPGEIPAARLDDAVRRILRVKAKLGLLDGSRADRLAPDEIGRAGSSRTGARSGREIARAAQERRLGAADPPRREGLGRRPRRRQHRDAVGRLDGELAGERRHQRGFRQEWPHGLRRDIAMRCSASNGTATLSPGRQL